MLVSSPVAWISGGLPVAELTTVSSLTAEDVEVIFIDSAPLASLMSPPLI